MLFILYILWLGLQRAFLQAGARRAVRAGRFGHAFHAGQGIMHVRGRQFAFAHAGDGAAVTHGELAGQTITFVHRGHSGLQGLALAQRRRHQHIIGAAFGAQVRADIAGDEPFVLFVVVPVHDAQHGQIDGLGGMDDGETGLAHGGMAGRRARGGKGAAQIDMAPVVEQEFGRELAEKDLAVVLATATGQGDIAAIVGEQAVGFHFLGHALAHGHEAGLVHNGHALGAATGQQEGRAKQQKKTGHWVPR